METAPLRAALAALAIALVALPAGIAAAETTLSATIGDADGDDRLERRPGEARVVRTELAPASAGRERRRVPRIFFGQMSDTHVVDEESPLRVEFLDKLGPPLTSAYRPQEAISTQVVNAMAAQLRATTSPITSRRMELVMTTGDNSDNTQRNETRWLIDLLDGGTNVDPDSGTPGTCATPSAPDHRYDGVRGGGEYYEPDSSRPAPGNDDEDGPGYSPDRAENEREASRSSTVRDYPGLVEEANRPFRATGLGAPWYAVFGNHDALLQGNQPRNPALAALATGCVKVSQLSPAAAQAVAALGSGTPDPQAAQQAIDVVTADLLAGGGTNAVVPSDARRRPLRKAEWMLEHFATRGAPTGHGFGPGNLLSGQGNYSFRPKAGLRFIALDSIAETGGDGGNIDDTQFRWLHDQLNRAEAARELAFVFAHHSLETMSQPPVSPFPPGDTGGDLSPVVHYGLGPGGQTAPCALTTASAPPTPDESLRCLFLRHRGLIAFVNGHEHNNRITPFPRSGAPAGGFWQVNTAAHIDWPEQSRVIDVLDNRDGTLSLITTAVDHAAPTDPTAGSAGAARLASISRELSFNDPDSLNGQDGTSDARGTPGDRNAELLIRSPYPSSG